MTNRFETYSAAALDRFNAGFSSKAGQKDALDYVTRAYEVLRRELQDACLATPRVDAATGKMAPAVEAVYWDVPSYPHQFKAKHSDLIRAAFGDRFDVLIAQAEELVALRETIKAADIVPPAKDETKARAAKIVESIKARMDRLQARYLEAIDLSDVLDDGVYIRGLTANSHYVTNEQGTTFLRTFFYLHGKLTPLNTILAGAEEAARRAKA
jgi:hypothetical protein